MSLPSNQITSERSSKGTAIACLPRIAHAACNVAAVGLLRRERTPVMVSAAPVRCVNEAPIVLATLRPERYGHETISCGQLNNHAKICQHSLPKWQTSVSPALYVPPLRQVIPPA